MPLDTESSQSNDLDEQPARRLFAWNLRHRRKSQHLRQRDVASGAGVSQSSLSQIERGRLSISLDLADRLARAVKSRLRDLLKLPEARVERLEKDIVVHIGQEGMTREKADTLARELATGLRRALRQKRQRDG